jgi:hypothetical protein
MAFGCHAACALRKHVGVCPLDVASFRLPVKLMNLMKKDADGMFFYVVLM